MSNTDEALVTTPTRELAPSGQGARPLSRADWLLPAGLILLSLIPFIAGIFRVVVLARGAEVTPENARFFAVPLPVLLHILGALPFCVLGAFQFAPGFRRRWPTWHRRAGRALVLCGLTAGLSGLWMTQFYPLYPQLQNRLLYGFRMLFGSAMVLSILLSLVAIRRRKIARHRAWIMRGYALGQGAGTQAFTAITWLLIFGTPNQLTMELLMGASWAINLAVAEWIIRRERARPALPRPTSPGARSTVTPQRGL
jgi:uncharacterized membrane protein